MKTKKIIAVLVLALFTLSLCSCDVIDKAKQTRACYTDDTQSAVEWDGNIYKKVNIDPYYCYDFSEYVYLVSNEVPLLLTEMFGTFLSLSNDQNFISTQGSNVIFVKESYYDEFTETIAEGPVYYSISEEYYSQNSSQVSTELISAINDIIKNVTPVSEPNGAYSVADIYKCYKGAILVKDTAEYIVYRAGNAIFLVHRSQQYTGENFIPVPDKYISLFEAIL